MQDLFRLASLALMFVEERETLPVFVEWARVNHNKGRPGGKCEDEGCMFNSTIDEWHTLIRNGTTLMARMTLSGMDG